MIAQSLGGLDDLHKSMGNVLATLHKIHKGSPWFILERHLQQRNPGVHSKFHMEDAEGFITVGGDPLTTWISRGKESPLPNRDGLTHEELIVEISQRAERDIESLPRNERQMLVDHWLEQIRQNTSEKLVQQISDAEEFRDRVNTVHDEINRRMLLNADVIGITTTGLAKHISTLRRLRSKVIVCEEAAEVLEAHMISALMPGVEHFIQIGDHDQLRPQIKNYSLSLENEKGMRYQLDRSQFERLAVGQPGCPAIPIAQLNVQRRMRPAISTLIRKTIYPRLEDHDSVKSLPDVVGIRENVFWLNHDNMEDESNDDGRLKSHSNAWEVDMTKSLVRHFVRQGLYNSTDIAVLTPYAGQLQSLRAALLKDFEIVLSDRDEDALAKSGFEVVEEYAGANRPLQKKQLIETLRLATVDNFQGEEAKIIIVSLVRSNKERKVGFLRTKNRINVLVSRAQHGLYLIGNADTYCNIPMWVGIRRQLEDYNAVGRAFNLCCPRHSDTPIQCAEPDDFLKYSPEGGCQLTCDQRLNHCGHRCPAKCHSEQMHEAFVCAQPCPRIRSTCAHLCPKLCGESCGPCQTVLDGILLPCGHSKDRVPCFRILDRSDIKCTVLVQKKVRGCDHNVEIECATDVNSEKFLCPVPCRQILECGHQCAGTCGACRKQADSDAILHAPCRVVCNRPRNTCSHDCVKKCHVGQPCEQCDKRCEVWLREAISAFRTDCTNIDLGALCSFTLPVVLS